MRHRKESESKARAHRRKGYRLMTVAQHRWQVHIGSHQVVARSMERTEVRKIDLSTLSGWSWEAIERSRRKGSGFAVTPSMIADWLQHGLLPGKSEFTT